MTRVQKHKTAQHVNKLRANRKMADIAKASGNQEESEKQWGRLQRRSESSRLKSHTEYAERQGNKEKANTLRKEWSENIGKGKPAPFNKGGKVCW
jgi:hypothetical protein